MAQKAENLPLEVIHEITSDLQQKSYLHPVRMKILGHLAKRPMTISQVAEELKVHPANITHHFRNLEKSRLIRLVEERDAGRVIERYYQAVAQTFNIRPPEGSVEHVNAKVLSFLRNDLTTAISLSEPDDKDEVAGLIRKARIRPEQYAEFALRLEHLIGEFGKLDHEGGESYALNVSLYPHRKDYGPIGRIELKKKSKKTSKIRKV